MAVANLAIGTLGILSYWIRGNFWIAAVIATSIWLLGAAAIHVSEMVGAGNYNPGNAGVVFYMDIIGPALLIILLVYLRYAGRTRAEFANEERPVGQLRYLAAWRGRSFRAPRPSEKEDAPWDEPLSRLLGAGRRPLVR